MSKPKRPRDPNQLAKLMIDIASGDEQASRNRDAAAKNVESKRVVTPKARRPSK